MSINVHIYQSEFKNESRMLRITDSLARLNFFSEIIIFAVYSDGLLEHESLGKSRYVYRIKTFINPKGSTFFRYFFFLEWSIRILLKLRHKSILAVNPHSVPALPIAFIIKIWKKAKLVYDTHEIETEQYLGWSLTKLLSKIIENLLIKKSEIVFTTSDGYTEWYKKTYTLSNVFTVKNYSRKRDISAITSVGLREYSNCAENDMLFIYLGIIGEGRGIELLLNVFKRITPNKKIIFMGYGPMVKDVQRISKEYSNIYYHPAVASNEVYKYVQSCDVGFCLIENFHLSYYHTLPNKMLECLNVGVPVIVSDFPDMKDCVDEYDSGWVVSPDDQCVFRLVEAISKEHLLYAKRNAQIWSQHNIWETQELIIEKAYSRLFSKVDTLKY
jgi:glycosyltransferase involved in cell wall biosynthesis